jgi:hypothetical protein
MRCDGEVTFYQFQVQLEAGTWARIEICATNAQGVTDSLWREHTACGACWQRYGQFGFLDRHEAIAAIPYVIGKRPGRTIRIAKITKTQATATLAIINHADGDLDRSDRL